MAALAARFEELRGPCPNWNTKFVRLCELFWGRVDDDPSVAAYADAFTALLQDDDNLLLARNAIPELRSNAEHTGVKREILRRIERPSHRALTPPHFRAEQAAMHEVDMYRTWVLMCNRYKVVDEEERKQLRAWLDSCPIKERVVENRSGPGS